MKRPTHRHQRPSLPLPDELHPIVDSVVDVVFERLRAAASGRTDGVKEPPRGASARLNLPLPKQRKALAEALADLLLADLAGRTAKKNAGGAKKRSAAKRTSQPAKKSGRAKATPSAKPKKQKRAEAPSKKRAEKRKTGASRATSVGRPVRRKA